jgi:phospholipid/cholesterol/gamma-HCH transport system substrate-binding protein
MRRRDEVLVGLFTTVAIIILALASIWLVRGGLNRGYLLYSRFAWGSGIKQGAPVWLVGVTVGAVDTVDLDPAGTLVITYRIQRAHRVPLGSVATIVPNRFVGDKAIARTPPRPNPMSYEPGDTIPVGMPSSGLQAILQRADTLTTSLSIMMGTLKSQFVDSGGIREMRRTAFALNKVLETFNQVAAVQSRELQSTLVALRSRVNAVDSARIDSTMKLMQASANSLNAFTGELQNASTRFNTILTKVESGDGSLAKLMNDPALYNDLRRIATRVDSLMLDLMANPRKYLKFSVF